MGSHGGVEVLVGVKTAGTLAGRSPETIRRWVWSGRLPARREGNRLMVSRDDVLRLAGLDADRGGNSPPTLSAWTRETAPVLRRGGKGATASDLLLADRHERSDAGR